MWRARKLNYRKKLLKEVSHWLRLADKVDHYRRDVLSPGDLDALRGASKRLESTIAAKEESKTKRSIDSLVKVLRKCGGCYYPKSGWSENVEMFLVAAILAIGIRTFFIQPFKIPTNSMFPTYNGMTFKILDDRGKRTSLGVVDRAFRKVVFGARSYRIRAPVNGELFIPILPKAERHRNHRFHYRMVQGRKWLFFPARVKEYMMYIDEQPIPVRVPADFAFEKVIEQGLAPRWTEDRQREAQRMMHPKYGEVLRTGLLFQEGDTVLAFELLTGDALFVDRFSYHFFPPRIGDPFVFRTGKIEGITQLNRGTPDDKYYIKRLVGVAGDELYAQHPVLYRNGSRIEGAKAFTMNARVQDAYDGYFWPARLPSIFKNRRVGQKALVPEDHFFAMGDNSDESSDGRIWGYIPDKEVVGKALFIYYPFTKHWGLAD